MKIRVVLFVLSCLLAQVTNAKEFTQEEADRYNYLFESANEMIAPYLKIHGVKHSKANVEILNKAISMYDEAIIIHPKSWQSMWLRGKAYQALNDDINAYMSFKEAYRINQRNPDVVNEYILEATSLNRIEEALNANKNGIEEFPNHIGLQANYSLLLMLAGKLDMAISEGEKALRMEPGDKITENTISIAKEIKSGKRKQPKSIYELTNEI